MSMNSECKPTDGETLPDLLSLVLMPQADLEAMIRAARLVDGTETLDSAPAPSVGFAARLMQTCATDLLRDLSSRSWRDLTPDHPWTISQRLAASLWEDLVP